ncbi:MAG TPA: YjfB family protein [Burkholderiaceae bacterium]
MSVNSIASLSTAMATTQTDTQIGVAVLKKAIDIESSSALALLQALPAPAPANLPSNLGQNINTTA